MQGFNTTYYPKSASTTLTINTTSAATANLEHSGVVRLVALAALYYSIGAAPVAATTTGIYLPAGTIEYINTKDGDKIAAIVASGSTTLNITPMTL